MLESLKLGAVLIALVTVINLALFTLAFHGEPVTCSAGSVEALFTACDHR